MKGNTGRLLFGPVLVVLLVAVALPATLAQEEADTPASGAGITAIQDTISFQGRLLTAAGGSVAPGTYHMNFAVCSTSGCSVGTVVWQSGEMAVAVDGAGLFSVLLSGFQPGTFSGDRYLQITVCTNPEPDPCQGWDTLSTQPISSVALAVGNLRRNAQDSTTATVDSAYLLSVTNEGTGGGLMATADHEDGMALAGSSENGFGVAGGSRYGVAVYGESDSGTGVWGTTSTGTAVKGESGSGNGVYGSTSSGAAAGVYGTNAVGAGVYGRSTAGYGVQGQAYAAAYAGVYGENSAGTGVSGRSGSGDGVYGYSDTGYGVEAFSEWDYGVYGVTDSGPAGVYGSAASEAGVLGEGASVGVKGIGPAGVRGEGSTGDGVYGTSAGTNGVGVHGQVTGYGSGVFGENGGTGYGVKGTSTDSHGVYGSSGRSDRAGVFGYNQTGYGVWGSSDELTGVYGVSYATNGNGVYGSSASGYGVRGEGGQYGVRGEGGTAGVYAFSSTGNGVYALGNGAGQAGVWGQSSTATGVKGEGATDGVYGAGQTGVRGVGSQYGVRGVGGTAGVYATSETGYGLYALSSAAGQAGVWGQSSTAMGVKGEGATDGVYGAGHTGVHGVGSEYGVHGTCAANICTAIRGSATASSADAYTVGLEGLSAGYSADNPNWGVYGHSDGRDTNSLGSGVYGLSNSDKGYGVVGHNFWDGVGVGAYSFTGDIFRGYAGDYPNSSLLRFYVTNAGGAYADVGWYTFVEVPSPDGTGTEQRTAHTAQSPESWSEDFGTGSLVDGQARIQIEPLWAQTVNLAAGYRVFFTPLGECNGLYVAEKGATYFIVRELQHGSSDVEFDYRIIAHPRGQEEGRLEVISADTLGAGEPPARPQP